MEFNFKIKEDRLLAREVLTGNSGNVNVYTCSFEIADNADFTWLCVFRQGDRTYQQVIENGKCVIPKEVLENAGALQIGCYGTDSDMRISTNWLEFNISDGAYCEATMPEEPSPDVWESLVMNSLPYIGENGNWYVYDKAEKIYKDSGKASRGEKGDTGDKGDAGLDGLDGKDGADGYTPQRGVDYWTEEDITGIIDDIYDIKQDIVQEAGADKYRAMSQDAVSRLFSNALRDIKTGEAVAVTDVSPLEHTMSVKARSKNIAYDCIYNDTTSSSENCIGCIANLYKGKTYTFSFDTENTGATIKVLTSGRSITLVTSANVVCDGTRKSVTFTMTDDFIRNYRVTWVQLVSGTNSGLCSNLMIEEGTTATAYTPYVDVSTVSVSRYGANLFDSALVEEREHSSSGTTTTITEDGGVRLTGSVLGTATTVDRMAHPTGFSNPICLPAGTYSNLYGRTSTNEDGYFGFVFNYKDESGTRYVWEKTFTLTKPAYLINAAFRLTVGKTYDFTIYPSLVLGSVPEQAEYVEPTTHMPDADGTVEGLTSLYPSTTLLSDTEGVIIDCEYNRDINKAFEELINAIISLGGNV